MLVIDETPAHLSHSQGAYFDGSLELLRELAVTSDVDAALPRLSAIVSKMLPHDALRVACFDQRGRPVVNASTADVPDMMTSEDEDVIIDDLRTRALGASAAPHATERLLGAGYRSVLGVSTVAPEPVVRVAFWSKRPLAFNRTHVPLARRIAYQLGLGACRGEAGNLPHHIDDARSQRADAGMQQGVDQLATGTRPRVVGESVEWRGVLRKSTQVAATDTTVLVTGESGTGKEVVARFIHATSPRKTGPFVALNCAALPEQLLEAELFGYERGAFTGAHQAKPGQVELALGRRAVPRRGDRNEPLRAGEVPAGATGARVPAARWDAPAEGEHPSDRRDQPRPAQSRRARPVSGDLFYRLGVFDIGIPPLRERLSDIVSLSEAFLQEIGNSFGRPPAGLTREARQALLHYDWPGNVRELRNVLERATILSEGALIDADHLTLQSGARSLRSDTTDLSVVERTTIAKVLQECRGNKTKAARRLGLSRTQVHLRVRKYRTRASCRRVNANQCRACVEVHHAPIEANEADPARAVGTLSSLHAPTRTMRFSTGGARAPG